MLRQTRISGSGGRLLPRSEDPHFAVPKLGFSRLVRAAGEPPAASALREADAALGISLSAVSSGSVLPRANPQHQAFSVALVAVPSC